jgi:hypothetical protein
MDVKVDKYGRLDPTTMTSQERRAHMLNCIYRHILDNHSPIVPTDESIAEWLTFDEPTLFEETMNLYGKPCTYGEKEKNKLNVAVNQLKEIAEALPAGRRNDKTFQTIMEIIKEINSIGFDTYQE